MPRAIGGASSFNRKRGGRSLLALYSHSISCILHGPGQESFDRGRLVGVGMETNIPHGVHVTEAQRGVGSSTGSLALTASAQLASPMS